MDQRKTLVIGASGMIGKSLSNSLESQGTEVFRFSRGYEDVPLENIEKVIFCASPNYKGPKEILDQFFQGACTFLFKCVNQKIPVVFLSTNLVFDGFNLSKPNDSVNPLCLYGKHKSDLEKIVRQRSENTIVRFAKVIGPQTQPFFDWCDQLAQKKTISPFANLFISPISLSFVTRALTQIISENRSGVFHLASQDQISFSDVIVNISQRLRFDTSLIQRVQADPATFPRVNRQSGLDCQSTADSLGLKMPVASQAIEEFCDGLPPMADVRREPNA